MERKFTDDEIVKVVEICSKNSVTRHNGLTYAGIPLRFIFEEILDTLNRQNAEIERLADRNHKCIYLSDDETTEFCVDGPCPKFKTEKQIRAEAIKEFAERLKNRASGVRVGRYEFVTVEGIDNLVKEMTNG